GKSHELRRIDEAVAAAQKPLVAFLSLDDEEALIAQLRQYGVRELSTVRAPGHGKMFPSGDARTAFFDDILVQLRATEVGEALVLVGPGFTREAFVEYLKARDPPLAAKVHVHGTAHAGMQGIQEALRAGVGAKVFGESRVGYETQLVEKLLEAIATDRPVAYGPGHEGPGADGERETPRPRLPFVLGILRLAGSWHRPLPARRPGGSPRIPHLPRGPHLVRLSDRLLRPARGRQERPASRDVPLHDRARRRGSRGRPEGPRAREDPPAGEQLRRHA